MSSFAEERNAMESALSDFVYQRQLTTEQIDNGGQSGPEAVEACYRLRESADKLIGLLNRAQVRAWKGEL